MARLPALLDVMAGLGIARRPTMDVYARKLREAGLISPGLKGMAGRTVPAADAAAILLATMITDSPSEAPRLFRRYADLLPVPAEDARTEAPAWVAGAWDAPTALHALTRLLAPPAESEPRVWGKPPGARVTRDAAGFDVVLGRTHPGLALSVRPTPAMPGSIARIWGTSPPSPASCRSQVGYPSEVFDGIAPLVGQES